MARACITNVNNHAIPFLEKLRTEGKITRWWHVGGTPDFCFEFDGHLEIDITDYHAGVADYILDKKALYERLVKEFRTHVIIKIINTLKGGEILGFTDTWIELRSTERTEIVTFRVTREEKERLVEEARRQGLSLSDYIRRALGL